MTFLDLGGGYRIANVPLDRFVFAARPNPNVMTAEDYESLVRALKAQGRLLQPLLARDTDSGAFEIVDGRHRHKGCGEAGILEALTVIGPIDATEAELLRIGMNRLRGAIDVGVAASNLADLSISRDAIEEITGFSQAELSAMLDKAASDADALTDASASESDEPDADLEPDDEEEEAYTLEITFADKSALQRAKRALRKVGGGDICEGLIALIDQHKAATASTKGRKKRKDNHEQQENA